MNESSIQRWLRSVIAKSHGNVEAEKFILDYGREFEVTPVPKHISLGPPKECFSNAINLTDLDKVMYVEGFACLDDGIPFHHACVSFDKKTVVDVTLRASSNRIKFLGILFPTDLALPVICSTGSSCVSPPIDPRITAYLSQC